ncbi:MAG: ABC transporter substrate-binding protein, partial [Alphaproteobacteria bacterium]
LVITGALEDGPEGAMVVSRIDQSGGRPFEIIWRIRQTNNGLRIVDVLAGGLSLAKTRRDDYASTIRRVNGDLDAFIDILRRQYETNATSGT